MSSKRFFLLALTLLTIFTFKDVYQCGFLDLDDDAYVSMNPAVQKGLTWESVWWAFTADLRTNSPNADYWQPVTMLARIMISEIFGLEPSLHHLVNLGFHVVNVLLVFHLLCKMTGSIKCSVVVAALFAVHPLKVQSVVWITELKDLLSAMFFLLVIWAYLRWIAKKTLKRWFWVILIFILGMLSKPVLMTLPFVLLLLDYWPLRRVRLLYEDRKIWWSLMGEKWALFLLTAIGLVPSVMMFRSQIVVAATGVSWLEHAPHMYAFHFYKMVFPIVSIFYARDYDPYLGDITIFFAGLLLIGLTTAVLIVARRQPVLFVGLFWFLGMLVPLNFVFIHPEDRFLYLPSIGFFIVLVFGMSRAASKWRIAKGWLVTASLFVISLYSYGCSSQIRYWKNSETLYQHTLARTPENWFFLNNMGVVHLKHKQYDEALGCFLRSIRLCTELDKRLFSDYNLCITLLWKGKSFREIEFYNKALDLKVSFDEKLRTMFLVHVDHLLKKDVTGFAATECEFVYDQNPESIQSRTIRGVIQFRQGKYEESAQTWRSLIRTNPNIYMLRNKLAWILATNESLRPKYSSEACRIASELCSELNYKNAIAMDTLAAAYAADGQFENAIAIIQNAAELASRQDQKDVLNIINLHIQIIRRREPINSQGQQFPYRSGFDFGMEPIL